MKICIFGDAIEMHLRRWANEFLKRGCEVVVITLNELSESFRADYAGCQLEIIKKPKTDSWLSRITSLPSVLWQLHCLVKKHKPDLFHAHSAVAYAWLPMLLGIRPRIVSVWGSDILLYINDKPIEYFLTKRALISSNLVHCDGDNTLSSLLELGVPRQKIVKCFFGTDTEKFKPTSNTSTLRQRLQIPTNVPVIISIRTLTPVHDVITFIKAMPTVLKSIPDAHFLIAGPGILREQLEAEVANMGLTPKVHFLGRLAEEQVAEALAASSLYVSTSLSESGLAGSTAEAMSCGLPVINTNTGDITEWIEDGKTGFIIPPSQPELLAEKIIAILNSKQIQSNALSLNRTAIASRNNIKTQMDLMLNAYQSVSER